MSRIAAAFLVVTTLLVSGCAAGKPATTPSPTQSEPQAARQGEKPVESPAPSPAPSAEPKEPAAQPQPQTPPQPQPRPAPPPLLEGPNQRLELSEWVDDQEMTTLPEASQKPGVKVWSVDPFGRQAPKLILERSELVRPRAVSPDGRYLLLTNDLGQQKGDYTALPYLFDRVTGQLREGPQMTVQSAIWSGKGFYVNRLTNLDPDMREIHHDRLSAAMLLRPLERVLVSISVTSDGQRFAALVGHPWDGQPLDLVRGNTDGTGLVVTASVVAVRTAPSKAVAAAAAVAWSPDGQSLAVTGKDGATLVRASDPDPARWTWFPADGQIAWAPDGRHVWFSEGGVFDLNGKRVLDPGHTPEQIWLPDGSGVVVPSAAGPKVLRLDGTVSLLEVPSYWTPTLFLPDGTLLIWSTVQP